LDAEQRRMFNPLVVMIRLGGRDGRYAWAETWVSRNNPAKSLILLD